MLKFTPLLFLLAATALAQSPPEGIGALGKIEPQSRVLRLSHNQGPEGARLWRLTVKEGQKVAQGEVLALLADHDKKRFTVAARQAALTQLRAELQKQQAERKFAQAERLRYQTLAQQSQASQSIAEQKLRDLTKAEAELKRLSAAIEQAKAELNIAETEFNDTLISAPIAGTVLAIHSWPGERIGDDGILELADLTRLDVVAEVYEADLPRVSPGQRTEIKARGVSETYSATVRELGFLVGKNDLNDTDPLADRDSRVIEVRLTLEDAGILAFRHQLYRQVEVRIFADTP